MSKQEFSGVREVKDGAAPKILGRGQGREQKRRKKRRNSIWPEK